MTGLDLWCSLSPDGTNCPSVPHLYSSPTHLPHFSHMRITPSYVPLHSLLTTTEMHAHPISCVYTEQVRKCDDVTCAHLSTSESQGTGRNLRIRLPGRHARPTPHTLLWRPTLLADQDKGCSCMCDKRRSSRAVVDRG